MHADKIAHRFLIIPQDMQVAWKTFPFHQQSVRNDDEDQGTVFGFDARSVAQINKKMIDDVKVILAEYRLALKIYNTEREK